MEHTTILGWLKGIIGADDLTTLQQHEGQELQARLDALASGNALLKGDLTNAETELATVRTQLQTKVSELESELLGKETKMTALSSEIDASKTKLATYEAHYEAQNGKGRRLPVGDNATQLEQVKTDSVTSILMKIQTGAMKPSEVQYI